MSWILLATFGQFLNAVVAILDKYIVSDKHAMPRPFVYAFYTCILTGAWVLVYVLGFLPLPDAWQVPTYENVTHPTLIVVALSLLAAYTLFLALVSMYDALKHSDASDVLPVIGAVSALASFGLSYYFLDGRLSQNYIIGVFLLAAGTFLVSRSRFPLKIALISLHSGIFFALHYITMKGLFNETTFDNGFFWSRIALVFFAISLLMVPAYFEKIREQTGHTTKRAGLLVFGTKMIAGVAAFLILKATDWGDVAVVQALDGLKYVFIILLSLLFVKFLPPSASDDVVEPLTLFRKIMYIAIISTGFVVLFI
jgi:uncharacterized membrane protein